MWGRFCEAVGRMEWRDDPRFRDRAGRLANVEALDALVESWTCDARGGDRDAALAGRRRRGRGGTGRAGSRERPAARGAGLLRDGPASDPWLRRRHGCSTRLTETPVRTGVAGQAIGQDQAYVFGEVLGMSAEEIARAVLERGYRGRRMTGASEDAV